MVYEKIFVFSHCKYMRANDPLVEARGQIGGIYVEHHITGFFLL